MTHIDPFAPADSPAHPANFRVPPRGDEQAMPVGDDAMPRWIRLADEPVTQDNPDAAIIGQQRWEEYHQLIDQHGTDDEKTQMGVRSPWGNDVNMPTLGELRARATLSPAETPEDDDLAAKLAALDKAGL